MDQLRPIIGNPLVIFVPYILLILCLLNVSNKFYHVIGGDQLSAQHKRRTGECCLGENCVSSWSSYGLKRGIPWFFFVYLYFIHIISSWCFKQNLSFNRIKSIVCRTHRKKDYQEPVDINKDTDVTYDQESKEICTNTNVTDADIDSDMGLK